MLITELKCTCVTQQSPCSDITQRHIYCTARPLIILYQALGIYKDQWSNVFPLSLFWSQSKKINHVRLYNIYTSHLSINLYYYPTLLCNHLECIIVFVIKNVGILNESEMQMWAIKHLFLHSDLSVDSSEEGENLAVKRVTSTINARDIVCMCDNVIMLNWLDFWTYIE